MLYHFAEVSEDGIEIWNNIAQDFNGLSAYSFMIFNLLCAPCFAAMGAIKREMGNAKWTWIAIGYMTVFSYVSAMVVYQIGMLFTGVFTVWSVIAIIVLLFGLFLLIRPKKNGGEI